MKNVISILYLTCLLACKQQPKTHPIPDYLSRFGIRFDSTDIHDISYLKDTITGAPVIAKKNTWKAWANDVERHVSPGDTVDWVKMEVLYAE